MPFSFIKKLFAPKDKGPEYTLLVWRDHKAKWKGLVSYLGQAQNNVLLLAWFPDTLRSLEYLLQEMKIPFGNTLGHTGVVLMLADSYLATPIGTLPAHTACVMVEHYPLNAPEMKVLAKLAAEAPGTVATVYACMDEEIYVAFNGKRIKEMMVKMGFKEDETVEHTMIRNSIVKAQARIAEKLVEEQRCNNDKEWFARNFKL